MRLTRTLAHLASPTPPSALVIGNFDGLHLGHQALIGRMQALAKRYSLTSSLMCFEPLPSTFFQPEQPVHRLMSVRDKVLAARDFGIDHLLMLRFNHALASLSPEEFAMECVVGLAGARHVVIGEDFRFGVKASGDVAMLTHLGERLGFEVHPVSQVSHFGQRISSSRIRASLADGDLDTAQALLGRPYAISGRVLHGQKLGRKIGFPTVNIHPPNPPALRGIFAVRVNVNDHAGIKNHPGVASLGSRPTVNGQDWLLEVHLFDYDGCLYGHHLEITFKAFIRSEAKFESVEAMVEEMHRDAEKAKMLLQYT